MHDGPRRGRRRLDGRLGRAALDVFAEEPTPVARWADLEQVVLAAADALLETWPDGDSGFITPKVIP